MAVAGAAMWFAYQDTGINVERITASPTQALIAFQVPDAATQCTVEIYTDESQSALINDVNEQLFAGSQNCKRPGSLVDGNHIVFVAGLRKAQKASDGRFYSRALETNRKHYYRIRSGSLSKMGSFETSNIPLGKLYGEPYPFDKDAPGHYAWPSIDWTDSSKEYIDPLTGVVVKRMSGPGMSGLEVSKPADGVLSYDVGGGWNGDTNAAAIDNRAATFSGADPKPLFIRAPQFCPNGWGCERAGKWDAPYRGLDDVEVTIKAWCSTPGCRANSGGERNIDICLSADGVNCATGWKTVPAATSSSGSVVFPSKFPAPILSGWIGEGGGPLPRPALGTLEGKVNTEGNKVTWASGHKFPIELTAGSRIRIGDREQTIESVEGAGRLTVAADLGTLRDAPFTMSNFGLLIRKSTSSADLLEVDGVSFRTANSQEFEMPASGTWNFCSSKMIQDSQGKDGYICSANTADRYPTLWFVSPSDGESRFLGVAQLPFNADTSGGPIDGNAAGCLAGIAVSSSDPNQIYCMAGSSASPDQGLLIFRGTYQPQGKRGCNQPSGYQAIPSGDMCNVNWELLTKPSQNRGLMKQAASFDPSFDPKRYPYIGLFAYQGGKLGFYAWAAQDTMAWTIWVDEETQQIVSMQNYHSNAPCRFCIVHSFLPLGDEEYNAVVVKDFNGGGETGAGPYEVEVKSVVGSNDGAVAANTGQACPADLDDKFKATGATGSRCIVVTLSGDPCDSSPSQWEKQNAAACPWQPNAITLQPIAEGDEAQSGNERFLFVKNLGENRWVLMRNHNLIHGPTLKENTSRASEQKAGWKLRMVCSAATGSGYVWVKYGEDAHGTAMIRDNSLSRAQHGDITALGTIMGDYDVEADRLGRFIWSRPIADRRNTPADFKILNGVTFGAVPVYNTTVFQDYIQTHPSWRQIAAPEKERGWYLDGNPFAPQTGSQYGLWRQPAALVSGSLHKLGRLPSPLSRKVLPTVAWSGAHLLEDVSGPQARLSGEAADSWKYCVADANDECAEGSRTGDVYLNAPGMTIDGMCGESFNFRRPCFTSMVNAGIGIAQYGSTDHGTTRPDRFLTGHFQRYNFTWTYANAVPVPNGTWAVTSGSWLEGVRNDLLLVKIPPQPEPDGVDRNNFVPVTVEVPAAQGASKARVRFGYAENGPVDAYYCTSRREACATGGQPYAWAGEQASMTACASGCTVQVPGISGRVVYWVVDWFDDGGGLVRSGGAGAAVVP